VNVLKPPGMTSHDVVDYVRKCLGTRRVGHTGTLDPGAAGVLVVCVGQATRLSEFLLSCDKTYRAEAVLGIETDTLDAHGDVTARAQGVEVSEEEAAEAVGELIGEHEMVPPMHSAVRHKGRRLYELARAGREVERRPRHVTVKHTQLVRMLQERYPKLLFDVCCSSGTYVRSLCASLGERLGCGAHLSFLLRTRVGHFHLEGALTLEQIAAGSAEDPASLLQPPEVAVAHLPSFVVGPGRASRLACGGVVTTPAQAEAGADGPESTAVRVHGPAGELLCIAAERLTLLDEKLGFFRTEGVDLCAILRFDTALSRWSCRQFVRRVLRDGLGAAVVVAGAGHTLGAGGGGDLATLQRLGAEMGFGVESVPDAVHEGERVSSSSIRDALSAGDVAKSAAMLGRPYSVCATVSPGRGVGERLGYRTANLPVDEKKLLPADGVYAGYACAGAERYPAVAHVGGSPTFGEAERLVEVHILDRQIELAGRTMCFEMVERIRSPIRFAAEEQLRTQIAADVARARGILRHSGARCRDD